MNKPVETVDDFLEEVVAYSHGAPIRRKDTLAMSRIQFLRETFPIIFAAGQASATRKQNKK